MNGFRWSLKPLSYMDLHMDGKLVKSLTRFKSLKRVSVGFPKSKAKENSNSVKLLRENTTVKLLVSCYVVLSYIISVWQWKYYCDSYQE